MLDEYGLRGIATRTKMLLEIDGCVVEFVYKEEYHQRRLGTRGWGEFWDHWVDVIE